MSDEFIMFVLVPILLAPVGYLTDKFLYGGGKWR